MTKKQQEPPVAKIGQKYKWTVISDAYDPWEVIEIDGAFVELRSKDGAVIESREDLFVKEFELIENV